MSLFDELDKLGQFSPVPVPELRYLSSAAERVRERWPDIQVANTEKEREVLAQKLRSHVENGEWEDTRLSFVVAAASAVFDLERRSRPDLDRTRDFLYAEVASSTSETFLSGLLRAYLDSYEPNSLHTTTLASALREAIPRMNTSGRLLLEAVPELIDPVSGPGTLAARMSKMSEPYTELLHFGIRNPHGSGFMDLAHLSLTSIVQPDLFERKLIDWYIRWLRPPGKEEARNTGAEQAIEALIHPWLQEIPDDKLRTYLVETLIELYGDPRIRSGGAWGAIHERYMAVVHRWLTREDMRFFTGVVDATQKDAMWPPRRDFWLKLYDEGLIDAAWAALSKKGFEYARQNLMRQDAKNAYTRVGYQRARQNTSLLIMKIGNKIMVDGCHSYRSHVFDIADPMAPKLFEEGYDCDQIMRASDRRASGASKSHSSIPSWSRWVRDMINADVPWSQHTRQYTKVFRPRPPKQRYSRPLWSAPSRDAELQAIKRRPNALLSAQDLSKSAGAKRSFLVTEPTGFSGRPAVIHDASPVSRQAQSGSAEQTKRKSDHATSLKNTRFPSLTDRMIAYGPDAANVVLTYLEEPSDQRTRPLLSPKSREGLDWVQKEQGELPLRLRNALEYLLINLKTSGVDLDDLFAPSLVEAQMQEKPAELTLASIQVKAPWSETFPPLPDDAEKRLDLLREHVDAIEDLAKLQSTFQQRKIAIVALQKLKDQSPDIRPIELAEIQSIYENLRRGGKGRRK